MNDQVIKSKILLVEDDRSLLNGLIDKFTRENFQVLSAVNGEEGLSSAILQHPDVILLDVLMAQMDGFTMLQKLRASGEWGKIVPVVFLTNLTPDSDRVMERIIKDEPAFYLVKSDSMLSDVVDKVRECLAAPRAEKTATQ